MTAQLVQPSGVPFTPPSRTPHGSILDYAEVREGVSFLDPAGLVQSFNCIGLDVDEVACAGFKSLTKRFDPPAISNGAMFVVQGGMTCKPFGFKGDDPGIRKAFEAKEGEGVSLGLFTSLFDTATDITPGAGTSLPPATALGILEGKGYLDYAGQPIIHMGPGMISQLASANALRIEGGGIYTMLGTPVAVSGGYETKTAGKLDADQWAYVTGAIVLARSEVTLVTDINRSTNDVVVLYERLYVAGIDCLVAKVKVKVF